MPINLLFSFLFKASVVWFVKQIMWDMKSLVHPLRRAVSGVPASVLRAACCLCLEARSSDALAACCSVVLPVPLQTQASLLALVLRSFVILHARRTARPRYPIPRGGGAPQLFASPCCVLRSAAGYGCLAPAGRWCPQPGGDLFLMACCGFASPDVLVPPGAVASLPPLLLSSKKPLNGASSAHCPAAALLARSGGLLNQWWLITALSFPPW